jgi:hypothetical protein
MICRLAPSIFIKPRLAWGGFAGFRVDNGFENNGMTGRPAFYDAFDRDEFISPESECSLELLKILYLAERLLRIQLTPVIDKARLPFGRFSGANMSPKALILRAPLMAA